MPACQDDTPACLDNRVIQLPARMTRMTRLPTQNAPAYPDDTPADGTDDTPACPDAWITRLPGPKEMSDGRAFRDDLVNVSAFVGLLPTLCAGEALFTR